MFEIPETLVRDRPIVKSYNSKIVLRGEGERIATLTAREIKKRGLSWNSITISEKSSVLKVKIICLKQQEFEVGSTEPTILASLV